MKTLTTKCVEAFCASCGALEKDLEAPLREHPYQDEDGEKLICSDCDMKYVQNINLDSNETV